MMQDLPDPPLPADVDLTDMPKCMFNFDRLFNSELWALATGDQFKAAFSLWGKAWKQVPAASLPDNDRLIQAWSGIPAPKWAKCRDIVLRGFKKCSDGRLYHLVLAEDALRAWGSKIDHLAEREADRVRLKRWRDAKKQKRDADETRFTDVSKRERNVDVTSNTVQDITERKEDIPDGISKKNVSVRGNRLPDDWKPDPDLAQWASEEGYSSHAVTLETDKFCDFWHGKSGKDATKLDWPATFRNWMRNSKHPIDKPSLPPLNSANGDMHGQSSRETTAAERAMFQELGYDERRFIRDCDLPRYEQQLAERRRRIADQAEAARLASIDRFGDAPSADSVKATLGDTAARMALRRSA